MEIWDVIRLVFLKSNFLRFIIRHCNIFLFRQTKRILFKISSLALSLFSIKLYWLTNLYWQCKITDNPSSRTHKIFPSETSESAPVRILKELLSYIIVSINHNVSNRRNPLLCTVQLIYFPFYSRVSDPVNFVWKLEIRVMVTIVLLEAFVRPPVTKKIP